VTMDRHPGDGPPAAAAVPRRLLETGRGSRWESFGVTEWLLLAVPVLLRAQLAALVLLLDERVAAAAVAGTALVVGGAWPTSRRER
jgi:hypothetical protein